MKTSLSKIGAPKSGSARESGGVVFWLVVVVVLFLLFMMTIGPGMLEPGFVLIFGWIQFLQRTLPALTWNWDLVGMSIFASIGILVLLHTLVGGMVDKVANARNLPWRWSWKWTWSSFVGLLVIFAVGMAVGGIAHQVGWLMSSQEPMIESKRGKWRDYANMKQLELEIRMALEDESGDVEKARVALRGSPSGFLNGSPITQIYHVLLVKDGGAKVIGRLIFPRDGQKREAVGGYFSFDSGESSMCSWSRMQEMVKSNRTNLIAL